MTFPQNMQKSFLCWASLRSKEEHPSKETNDGNGRKVEFHSENSKLVDKFLSMPISSEISGETDLELVVSTDKGYRLD